MERNIVEAELSGSVARVRLQTYQYDTPSEQVRKPSQHHLALILTRRPSAARYTGRLESGRIFSLGDLIYVPAAQSICGTGPGGAHQMITCAFPAGLHPAFNSLEHGWDDEGLMRCGNLRSDWIVESMRRLGREALQPGFASDMLLDSLATALPIELHRLLGEQTRPRPRSTGGLSPHQLRLVETYVHDWPDGGIKVPDLAGMVGLSRGHFMRAFRQSTGRTVHAYVEDVRLNRAKDLLCEDRLALKQIAVQLGFADVSSFSLAFRRMTGVAPGRYRSAERLRIRG